MSTLVSHAQQAAGSVGNQLQRTAGSVGSQILTTADRLVPPKQREQNIRDLRAFSHRNPKLAVGLKHPARIQYTLTGLQTFLAAQIALLGVPLLLFIAFAVTTLCISLATCLLFAVTTALFYTFFAIGIALFFLVPILFLASFAASCFFLWGLVVYLILQRFNEGEAPAKPGTRVGDKIHGLTGGRLGWMVDGDDATKVDMGTTQDDSHTNGDTDYHGGGNPSRQGGDGYMNGGEWKAKWAHGTQQQQKEFANKLNIKVDEVPA
ncbi:hypothetical protein BDU57DRAFT_539769 [Ampelomyces quisqualis]|uniref:Uncharacterized protein n=1 Tax=Ampelomyces quisqualis TaxID=50730 RepID=A0A6A5QLR6_AMPQU|nr:hypothetical protein BDU57DRAFT_539769 [Ampelomyces quisqualis]